MKLKQLERNGDFEQRQPAPSDHEASNQCDTGWKLAEKS